MKNDDVEFSTVGLAVRRLSRRAWAVVAAFGAVLMLLVLNPGVAEAQFDFDQFIAAILLQILQAFEHSPFFSLIGGVIEAILHQLEIIISGLGSFFHFPHFFG